ncbi:MAG: ferritin-like domain-containing protein, partial [Proteobacteria bacterium]|nr:ferritin-like domain-containing protein [Pseudomonadota bacterium]
AIDLAFDMAVRFAPEVARLDLDPGRFVADWFGVGGDEARHFGLIEARLGGLGCAYGDLPAHDGLWEAAEKTADNLAARLVVAPLILEARGLDVTPDMIRRLQEAGDRESAAMLEIVYRDEIGHVSCGKRWFHLVCQRLGRNPAGAFHDLRKRYFSGQLKAPFNYSARDAAGLPRAFYEPKRN